MQHAVIKKEYEAESISVKEWERVISKYDNFFITNELKQQNPITKEFIFIEVKGSGYWQPHDMQYDGWPHDGKVWFFPYGRGITFIQFQDIENHELKNIASEIDAIVKSEAINES